jgi:hypothetical protein
MCAEAVQAAIAGRTVSARERITGTMLGGGSMRH